MSKVEINFSSLKFNLYEILNVKPDADDVKIKKNYVKILKNYHPDKTKSSDLESDIWQHIIDAGQILLSKESRKKYDNYLKDSSDAFNELKSSFQKNKDDLKQYFPDESTSKIVFKSKLEELNKKHGFCDDSNSQSVTDRFNKIQQTRNSSEITIEKDNIKSSRDFNDKFNTNKSTGKFKDQIIEYNQSNELSTYTTGDNYTSLADIDKLYVEDSVQNNKFTSLDRAFMLQPTLETLDPTKSFESRMSEYRNQTTNFKNMKNSDFSVKKFDEWRE